MGYVPLAMGYVPLAMGYVPLAMGYDVLFVDTRTCNLLYTDLPTCVLVEVGMSWEQVPVCQRRLLPFSN